MRVPERVKALKNLASLLLVMTLGACASSGGVPFSSEVLAPVEGVTQLPPPSTADLTTPDRPYLIG